MLTLFLMLILHVWNGHSPPLLLTLILTSIGPHQTGVPHLSRLLRKVIVVCLL
jgi:hypothetical protein